MTRLDAALSARGLVSSRNRAAREIAAGRVRVDGRPASKASQQVSEDASIELLDPDPWVARSAHKLLGALDDLNLHESIAGARALDAGASTGGFTQVLLQAGASSVLAIDVGRDQLDPIVAADPRVESREGVNLRDLTPGLLSDARVDLVVADVSFISLRLLIAPLLSVCAPGALLLLMVKPQFESGRSALDKHGVVTRPADRADAIASVAQALRDNGVRIEAAATSALPGPSGNREYFLSGRAPGDGTAAPWPVPTLEDFLAEVRAGRQ